MKCSLLCFLWLLALGSCRNDAAEASVAHEVVEPDPAVAAAPAVPMGDYRKDGLLLPGRHAVLVSGGGPSRTLQTDAVTKVKILRKSIEKLSLASAEEYCANANYVQIVVGAETLTLFGDRVLEITARYTSDVTSTQPKTLYVAEDFTVKASDDEGLTGCSDFSYLVVDDGKLSVVSSAEANYYTDERVASLYHDDGMHETIEGTTFMDGAIHLQILRSLQDGGGDYVLEVKRAGSGWRAAMIESNFR